MGLRLAQAGTVELSVETAGALGPDVFFDDVRVQHTASTIVQEQHQYAFGAPMKELNYVVGPKNYRHGYQGQFAERDEETGLDAFELRQYDARIGRWTAPDPAGQFASPYVGMGNNPVSSVDPDGGFVPLFNGAETWGLLHYLGKGLASAGSAIGRGAVTAAPYGLQVGMGAAAAAVRIGPDWASKWRYQVHQQANFNALYNTSASSTYGSNAATILKSLNKATVDTDANENQTAARSYMHAMSPGVQNAATGLIRGSTKAKLQARDDANRWIRYNYNAGLKFLKSGNISGAYYFFGIALHTLQDATSPAHYGFQPWPDDPTYGNLYKHGTQELTYPGLDSNLQKVTNYYLLNFSSGVPLPDGDLFKIFGHDR